MTAPRPGAVDRRARPSADEQFQFSVSRLRDRLRRLAAQCSAREDVAEASRLRDIVDRYAADRRFASTVGRVRKDSETAVRTWLLSHLARRRPRDGIVEDETERLFLRRFQRGWRFLVDPPDPNVACHVRIAKTWYRWSRIDAYRKRQRELEHESRAALRAPRRTAETAADLAIEREGQRRERRRLRYVIGRLPEGLRGTARLWVLKNLGQVEIARRLGISVENSRQRCCRIWRRLHAAIPDLERHTRRCP